MTNFILIVVVCVLLILFMVVVDQRRIPNEQLSRIVWAIESIAGAHQRMARASAQQSAAVVEQARSTVAQHAKAAELVEMLAPIALGALGGSLPDQYASFPVGGDEPPRVSSSPLQPPPAPLAGNVIRIRPPQA